MLRFEMDLAATDLVSRTIEGTIVPYGEVATIAGTKVRFRPGSLKLARPRTPLLVDHDRSAPVGILSDLVELESSVIGRFRVDETPAGDTALVQAASGSRGSLSVGAEVDDSVERGGVLEVLSARLVEVSLLALGAFEGATVTRVAAEADEPEPEPEPDPDQTELELPAEPDDEPAPPAETPEGGTMTVEATAAPVVLEGRDRAPVELTAGGYALALVRAQQGDRDALRLLEAALTETVSTDLTGVLPPQYEGSVIGGKTVDRVLYSIFAGRPIPSVGLTIQKPTWTTFPAGAWASSVDADATTSKAVIGLNAATIERWDWGTAISYVASTRSSPDAIDTIYAQAIEDFHDDVETKIAALAVAAAGTANAAVKLGDGIAAFYTQCHRSPDVIVVAPDVWALLADAKMLDAPAGVGDSVRAAGGLAASFAGLTIAASAHLAAGSKMLATRRALDVRVTEPVRLTANAIGALNIELGVVGEGVFDADYPSTAPSGGEIMLLTAGAPFEASAASSSRRSS